MKKIAKSLKYYVDGLLNYGLIHNSEAGLRNRDSESLELGPVFS